MKRAFIIPTLTVALLLTAYTAQAQRSNTRGIFLNAHLTGTTMAFNDDAFDTQSGGGAGIQIGYGVSRLVTLYLGVDGSSMTNDHIEEGVTLAHVDLGVQLNFGRERSAARPYGTLAFTYREETFDFGGDIVEIDFSGGGVTLGGGLKYFLSRLLALDVGLDLTFGKFSDVRVGGITAQNVLDLDATSGRFTVGISWFPSRR